VRARRRSGTRAFAQVVVVVVPGGVEGGGGKESKGSNQWRRSTRASPGHTFRTTGVKHVFARVQKKGDLRHT